MVVIVAKFIGNGSETLIQGTEYSTLGGVAGKTPIYVY